MKNSKRTKMIKGILALVLILSLFIPYSVGHPQMATRVLVVAMGLDQSDSQISVSVKVTLPVEEGGSKGETQMLVESGETVAKALDNLSILLGRRMELSHLGILVISKEFNKFEELEYLLCSGLICPKINLTVSDNDSAEEFLNALSDYSEKLELYNLLKYMDLGSENHSQSLISFLTDINSVSNASLIPCIKMGYTEGEEKQAVIENVRKTAIYNKDGLVNIYNEQQTLGLAYLDKRNKKGNLFIELNGQNLSLLLNKKKVKIDTKIENEQPIFIIKLKLNYTVEDKHKLDYKSIESQLKQEIEKKINLSILSAIDSLRIDNADAIQISDHFYRDNNKTYKRLKSEGYDFLKNSQIKIDYNIIIN